MAQLSLLETAFWRTDGPNSAEQPGLLCKTMRPCQSQIICLFGCFFEAQTSLTTQSYKHIEGCQAFFLNTIMIIYLFIFN